MAISLLRSVPVLAPSKNLQADVEPIWGKNRRFRPVFVDTWDMLGQLCPAVDLCAVVVDRLDDDLPVRLTQLEVEHPGLKVVVVAVLPPVGSAEELGLPCAGLVYLPHDRDRLIHVLARAGFGARKGTLERRIDGCWAMPEALRGALRGFLRLRPERPAGGEEDPRTVRERSRLEVIVKERDLDAHPKTIRNYAKECGLKKLDRVRYAWIGVATAEVREFEEVGWDRLGLRLGYRGQSGLAKIYKRRFGLTLVEVARLPAEKLLMRFEEEYLGPLWTYQEEAEAEKSDAR